MNRRTLANAALSPSPALIDLDLAAQRIIKLAEIATLDHLDAIERSQAALLFTRPRAADPDLRPCRLRP